ncbi:hypothetical protein B0J18DRAFT_17012 [Chaetomium sp. MPI-SDFR-AT-0129]|nr:hypothetical protein B0J18DRAFT_17012 [Chaetomium sp. MPI-SDFR-AT-0129]
MMYEEAGIVLMLCLREPVVASITVGFFDTFPWLRIGSAWSLIFLAQYPNPLSNVNPVIIVVCSHQVLAPSTQHNTQHARISTSTSADSTTYHNQLHPTPTLNPTISVQLRISTLMSGTTRSSHRVTKTTLSKPSCGRCRGQKLRCIWDAGHEKCQRCAKADAVCAIPAPRPMGRPPRRRGYASGGSVSGSGSGSQDRDIRDWNEDLPLQGDETPGVSMYPASTVPPELDPLDFLTWVPEPNNLNFFVPRVPSTISVTDGRSTTVGFSNRPFSPLCDMASAAALNSTTSQNTSVSASAAEQIYTLNEQDHMESTTTTPTTGKEDHAQLLTQLCQLNVSLFQHPLHHNKARNHETATRNTPPQTDIQPPFSLSDLRTGDLFQLTCRLKDIVTQLRAEDTESTSAQGPTKHYDRSTALMVLSCYTRLEILYSRAVEILMGARGSESNNTVMDNINNHHHPTNTHESPAGTTAIMPELVIDGFSMGQCLDLQLGMLIQLHETARDKLRICIKTAERTNLYGRDSVGRMGAVRV